MANSDHRHDHDSHEHGNGHFHHHSHHHAPPRGHNREFTIAILLNTAFVVLEFTYGFIAQSTALMADAGHNLSDVLGLLLAWGAATLAQRQPTSRYTYGLRGSTILAAIANGMLLLVACGAIAWEAVRRLVDPPEVAGLTVALVAGAGVFVNGISAWLFVRGSKDDLNIRGAFLHMAADAAVSLGVVISGLIILYTKWNWIDPIIGIVIVAVILIGTWGLLKEALRLSLNAVPAHIDPEKVREFLASQPGVADVQDLHIWAMSTTENALTAHLHMPGGSPGDAFVDDISNQLRQRFSIHHCTLQIWERATGTRCVLDE